MKRYDYDNNMETLDVAEGGEWVLYADHAAALAERDARIAELDDNAVRMSLTIRLQADAIAAQRALLERAAGALEALGRACIHGAEDHDDVLWIDEVTLARREQCATLAAIRECIAGGKREGAGA